MALCLSRFQADRIKNLSCKGRVVMECIQPLQWKEKQGLVYVSKDPLLFTVASDGQFKFHWSGLENCERWDYLSLGIEIDLRIFELIEEDFF